MFRGICVVLQQRAQYGIHLLILKNVTEMYITVFHKTVASEQEEITIENKIDKVYDDLQSSPLSTTP